MKQILKNKWIAQALQNIKEHWVCWLLIMITALLGSTAILGTDGAARAAARSASEFYAERQYGHLFVSASHLLSPEDLEVIRGTEGVKDASVNFMMLKMNVEFEEGADAKAVMKNVRANCKKIEDDMEIYL